MNVPPVSVERVQKCVVNFEIYRYLKKAANLPHPPLCNVVSVYFTSVRLGLAGTPEIVSYEWRLRSSTWKF